MYVGCLCSSCPAADCVSDGTASSASLSVVFLGFVSSSFSKSPPSQLVRGESRVALAIVSRVRKTSVKMQRSD